MPRIAPAIVVYIAFAAGCAAPRKAPVFRDEVRFLGAQGHPIVLQSPDGAGRVVVCPDLQGRVMTSTTGPQDPGFGWINRRAVAAGPADLHFNNYGGEDRFWLGPEAGQFGLYFPPGKRFVPDNWYVPSALDRGRFEVIYRGTDRIVMQRRLGVSNYSGTKFLLRVRRAVRVLTRRQIQSVLAVPLPDSAEAIGFVSENTVTNEAPVPMTKRTGLLSIWILGQYIPSPRTFVIIPYVGGPEGKLGPVVNDAYFGKIPADRLIDMGGYLLFRADGRLRSKLGLSPRRAKDVIASIDLPRSALTIVKFTRPVGTTEYVNSMWQRQKRPYRGDVINSYNDGPIRPGAPSLGGFYELETSSPALELRPGQSYTHRHWTIHVRCSPPELRDLARRVLGIERLTLPAE